MSESKWIDRAVLDPNTGCWLWPGSSNPQGYGRISWKGKQRQVTHVSYEHFKGPVPKGMLVCHKCDTPACYNPDHLFLGTHLDNRRDQIKKGRELRMLATHCQRGHLITGVSKSIKRRRCDDCHRIADQKYRARRRAREKAERLNK